MSTLKQEYAELRRDPRWQKKRLEVMQRDQFECYHCSEAGKTLNVHHTFYIKGRMPWDYPLFSLLTLCEDCHKAEHELVDIAPDWERVVDWLSGGVPGMINGPVWYLAAAIQEATDRGVNRSALLDKITRAIRETLQ